MNGQSGQSRVIGIDVGTSGVRAILVSAGGCVDKSATRPLRAAKSVSRHEQNPDEWWNAVRSVLAELVDGVDVSSILAVAATSTSGTLVAADREGQPLRPAIMYDDGRSSEQASDLSELTTADGGRWNASHSLAKALWVRRNEPEVWERIHRLQHAADWLTGKLTGEFETADFTCALKLGYDPGAETWCDAVSAVKLPEKMLPRVVRPGSKAGVVCQRAALDTGLPAGTPVAAGATDGICGLLASGAAMPGDGNTTTGTTLVWKVLTAERPKLSGGVYAHRHPSGLWAPGAASSSGPGSLPEADETVRREARTRIPTEVICYPLRGRGERFPFIDPEAEGFEEGRPADPVERYAAALQGLAFIERWGYETLASQGVELGPCIYSTGGAAENATYAGLRASVMKRQVLLSEQPSAAFGAAILASACAAFGGDVAQAIRSMTRFAAEYAPDPERVAQFDDLYGRFQEACQKRGWSS